MLRNIALILLNYGIVPKAISIKETRDALETPDGRVPGLLDKAKSHDCVRQANLRLRTVAKDVKLNAEKSRQLWLAIATFFDSQITEDEMSGWTPWVAMG
jgi:hypothetical protein